MEETLIKSAYWDYFDEKLYLDYLKAKIAKTYKI